MKYMGNNKHQIQESGSLSLGRGEIQLGNVLFLNLGSRCNSVHNIIENVSK